MDKKTHDKGLEIRKAVLGEAYVSNALENADDFNKPFQELVTEYCWGAVWGPGAIAAQDPQHAQSGDDLDSEPAT